LNIVDLARGALAAATRTRLKASLNARESVCVFDLAQRLNIDLRFEALPSLEGMYSPGDPPIIVLSALRPTGRQRMNCAHELGHHVMGHGTRLDQLLAGRAAQRRFDPDEFAADCFAEYLLMPKLAILLALSERGIKPEAMEPIDAFRVSSYFGVGYRALIHHLEVNLQTLPPDRARTLRGVAPKVIRHDVAGRWVDGELLAADSCWHGRAIDLHTGDLLLLPIGTDFDEFCLRDAGTNSFGQLLLAEAPGITRVEHIECGWSSYVRIARRTPGGGYIGRSVYRHEPDIYG
jgi:Zn-dependent peptidase ImmA (M78 family)